MDIPVDDEGLEGPVEEPAPENNDLLGGTMDDPLPTPVGDSSCLSKKRLLLVNHCFYWI